MDVYKFLVVSYDSDQQQWFYDIVYATSEHAAKERISKLRWYVTDTDVFTFAQMEQLCRDFSQTTRESSEARLAELKAESGADEEE